ncbi:MAG: homoserine O-succinyltransferase [Bacteroidaceae bacterium]|nr:homoserine O-succinyltransferase [Bacteroidaceae bacterium]
MIKLSGDFPAIQELRKENILLGDEYNSADMQYLKIGVVNLMPVKTRTEADILRLLSNSALNLDITFISVESHVSKTTPQEHIDKFYKKFREVKSEYFDGVIITGAPVEKLDYEQVDYWEELCDIFEWSRTNARSTVYICWAAFAGLYHFYGIPKHLYDSKISGVFRHWLNEPGNPLFRGFDDEFFVPHSRFSGVLKSHVEANSELSILSEAAEIGVYIVEARGGREVFITGHSEYAKDTLDFEYRRDLGKGMNPHVPDNYYRDDDPSKEVVVRWKGHANLLFTNWIHYYVQPNSPYLK